MRFCPAPLCEPKCVLIYPVSRRTQSRATRLRQATDVELSRYSKHPVSEHTCKKNRALTSKSRALLTPSFHSLLARATLRWLYPIDTTTLTPRHPAPPASPHATPSRLWRPVLPPTSPPPSETRNVTIFDAASAREPVLLYPHRETEPATTDRHSLRSYRQA